MLQRKLSNVLTALALAALVFSLPAAAAQKQQPRDPERARNVIIKEIRHEVVMLPYYSLFDNITFTLENGKVTLMGQVVRPSLKSDIERVVKDVEGVEQVVNQIEVLPPSPMDDRLRMRLYRAIYGDAMLQRYSLQAVPPIHIIVNRGHVTLEGVVASEAEKNTAGIRASGVSGSFSVTNNLRVEK
jgi:hyperosmotically inducible protein